MDLDENPNIDENELAFKLDQLCLSLESESESESELERKIKDEITSNIDSDSVSIPHMKPKKSGPNGPSKYDILFGSAASDNFIYRGTLEKLDGNLKLLYFSTCEGYGISVASGKPIVANKVAHFELRLVPQADPINIACIILPNIKSRVIIGRSQLGEFDYQMSNKNGLYLFEW